MHMCLCWCWQADIMGIKKRCGEHVGQCLWLSGMWVSWLIELWSGILCDPYSALTIFVTFPVAMTQDWQMRLRGEKVYFDSQLGWYKSIPEMSQNQQLFKKLADHIASTARSRKQQVLMLSFTSFFKSCEPQPRECAAQVGKSSHLSWSNQGIPQ